jgi:hypothetical protein
MAGQCNISYLQASAVVRADMAFSCFELNIFQFGIFSPLFGVQ